MTKTQFKKLYSHYRKVNFDFRNDLENSNYPCGYDDALCENFERHCKAWLDNNPVIKQVLLLDDCEDGYNPVNENFKTYRYQNSWIRNGKIEFYKKVG